MMTAEHREMLYKEYRDRVLSYISARVSSIENAEDLCADMFEKALLSETNHNTELLSLGTRLHAIMRNMVIDFFRRSHPVQLLPDVIDDESYLDEDLLKETLLEKLASALEKPPEEQQVIIVLLFFDDIPLTQIAPQMEIRYSAVKLRHQ